MCTLHLCFVEALDDRPYSASVDPNIMKLCKEKVNINYMFTVMKQMITLP
jgi:hypothetical protein